MTIVVLLNAENAETMPGATALSPFVPLRMAFQLAEAFELSAVLNLAK